MPMLYLEQVKSVAALLGILLDPGSRGLRATRLPVILIQQQVDGLSLGVLVRETRAGRQLGHLPHHTHDGVLQLSQLRHHQALHHLQEEGFSEDLVVSFHQEKGLIR